MNTCVQVVVCIVLAVSVMGGPVLADSHGSDQPTFTKGKFAVPISLEDVTTDWTARGYSTPAVRHYAHGWSRGEHTHAEHLIITVVAGRMEFIIAGQRFVVEPGDELFYPAHMIHSARNLYDGTSQTLSGHKW
jgi:mannose-6-phosphate isomerase-like protein (cupin superfamily)